MSAEKRKGLLSRSVRVCKRGGKRGAAKLLGKLYGHRCYSRFGVPTGLIAADEGAIEPLYEERPFAKEAPQTLDGRLHWRFRNGLKVKNEPTCGLLTLKKAYATQRGCNLSSEGKLYTTYLQPVDGKKPHEYEIFELTKKNFSPKILKTDQTLVSLATWWQGGFYHWFFDVLSRLHLVEKAKIRPEHIFIEAATPFQKESLALLGITEGQMLNAHTYAAIFAPTLYVPTIVTGPTTWGCRFLRERMTASLKRRPKRRIYVTRRDATRRRIANEDALLPLIKTYGFECVTLSGLPLKEQMELFYNAEVVMGPHGAGFTHMLFADPGTPLLEFFSPDYVNICYWDICTRVSHPYFYLLGEGETHPDGFDPHRDPDITIDLAKLESILKQMGCD